jgi:hypothetical protein
MTERKAGTNQVQMRERLTALEEDEKGRREADAEKRFYREA